MRAMLPPSHRHDPATCRPLADRGSAVPVQASLQQPPAAHLAGGVQVRVAPRKGVEGPQRHPAGTELAGGVPLEAADVGAPCSSKAGWCLGCRAQGGVQGQYCLVARPLGRGHVLQAARGSSPWRGASRLHSSRKAQKGDPPSPLPVHPREPCSPMAMPNRPMLRTPAMDFASWSQVATLSPVQCAA